LSKNELLAVDFLKANRASKRLVGKTIFYSHIDDIDIVFDKINKIDDQISNPKLKLIPIKH
jgi:hypothetical protein